MLPGAPVRAPYTAMRHMRTAGRLAKDPQRPAETPGSASITEHPPYVIGMLRTATESGTCGSGETSQSRQVFGPGAAHAGRDMPRGRGPCPRSFSAADLRPRPREPRTGAARVRRRTTLLGARPPGYVFAPPRPRRPCRTRRFGQARRAGGASRGGLRGVAPGHSAPGTHGPGDGSTPPGPVRHPRGLWQRNSLARRTHRHSRLAEARADPRLPMQQPAFGTAQSARPGARPHIPGARAGRPCERAPGGPPHPVAPASRPRRRAHSSDPWGGSSAALSGPTPRAGKGLDSRHPTRDP